MFESSIASSGHGSSKITRPSFVIRYLMVSNLNIIYIFKYDLFCHFHELKTSYYPVIFKKNLRRKT